VAREWDGPVRQTVNSACPLQCWRRHGESGDQTSRRSDVDWAGLPINLDLAFSQQQCDKVYMQHLLRKQRAQLLRRPKDLAQLCVCDVTAERGNLDSDATSLT
jgi:hypothetical protein